MADRELLDAVIRVADPVPNPADPPDGAWTPEVVLLEIERRSASMPTQQRRVRTGRVPSSLYRRRAFALAGTLVATLLLLSIAALVFRSDPATPPVATTLTPTITSTTSSLPTTTSVSAGTGGPAEEAATRAVVDSAFALYNDGDVDGWVDVRDRGSSYESELVRLANLPEWKVELVNEFAAGRRIEVTDCTFPGLGQWPRVADDTSITGYYLICDTKITDAFREPAGLFRSEEFHWVVNDGDVVAVRSSEPFGAGSEYDAFMAQFFEWFRFTHRDLWDEITWRPDEYPDPETTALLVGYVDDYLMTLE